MSRQYGSSFVEIFSSKWVAPESVPYWRVLIGHAPLTQLILYHSYQGKGTNEDPYLVDFIPDDPQNAAAMPRQRKWAITVIMAVATLAVAFASSAYAGGVTEIRNEFGVEHEVAILGISLFVLGFAIGPFLWAPLSELYGRQIVFLGTYAGLTIFNAAAAGAKSIEALLFMRLIAGIFGASPMTNAGGVIADMFSLQERGLANNVFAAAPFLGPTLGPVVGGFVGDTIGWRWIQGIMAIFTGTLAVIGGFLVPETYGPVLLRSRAEALSDYTGQSYVSVLDGHNGRISTLKSFERAMLRPWALLFREPIVLLISIYMAIVFGTLYMLFAAFPIVFQEGRGWSNRMGGLAFTGVLVGVTLGVGYLILDNKRYARTALRSPNGTAPPECRLAPALTGSVTIPVGIFWFAWSNSSSVHWSVCISGTALFGFGFILISVAQLGYLIDSYTIHAASALAANTLLRSLFGAVFPLLTPGMYAALGLHWASSIPAFAALACLPFPFLFHRYGASIRSKGRYAVAATEGAHESRQTELAHESYESPEAKQT